jgi:hypothetical protein
LLRIEVGEEAGSSKGRSRSRDLRCSGPRDRCGSRDPRPVEDAALVSSPLVTSINSTIVLFCHRIPDGVSLYIAGQRRPGVLRPRRASRAGEGS